MVFVLLLVFYSSASLASEGSDSCEVRYSEQKLDEAMDKAETAFVELDVAGFSNSLEETILFLLPCLGELVSAPTAAKTHRLLALRAYSSRKDERLDPSLAAAKVLDPEYVWPQSMFPTGHEFRERYELMSMWEDDLRSLPKPLRGELWVDGKVSSSMPKGRASIIQYAEVEGAVRWTQYHMPNDVVPSYPVVPKTRNALLVSAGAQALVAGALLGASYAYKGTFKNPDATLSVEEAEGLQRRANGCRTASLVGASMSGATLGLSLVVWAR